jgi:hypothetical protein
MKQATKNDLLGLIDYLKEGAGGGVEEKWFERCAEWVEKNINNKK